MTNDEFQALATRELTQLLETLKNKNSDYTGGSTDPFANFKVTEALGLVNAETGVLVRMVDKIQRVKSFLSKGNLQVNESVQDSLRDIIGYSIILLGLLEDRPKITIAQEASAAWVNFEPGKRDVELPDAKRIQDRLNNYIVNETNDAGLGMTFKTSGAV